MTEILLTVMLSSSSFSLTAKSDQSQSIQIQTQHIQSPREGLGTIMMTVTESNKSLSVCIYTILQELSMIVKIKAVASNMNNVFLNCR